MEVLVVALGDAPTALLAIVAIVLGVVLVARGPRDTRAAAEGEADAPPPVHLSVPVAPAPPAEPGFIGPEGTVVGHGPIRLGRSGRRDAPVAPAPPPQLPPTPAPREVSEPAAAPQPEPTAPDPSQASGPAGFRHGTIKLGGRPAGKPPAG